MLQNSEEQIDLKFGPEELVVVPLGFKEEYKLAFEKKAGRAINGRVACFRIGKVKDIFKIKSK